MPFLYAAMPLHREASILYARVMLSLYTVMLFHRENSALYRRAMPFIYDVMLLLYKTWKVILKALLRKAFKITYFSVLAQRWARFALPILRLKPNIALRVRDRRHQRQPKGRSLRNPGQPNIIAPLTGLPIGRKRPTRRTCQIDTRP